MERIKITKQLGRYYNKSKFHAVIVMLILSTILSVIYPFIYKYFIDHVLYAQNLKNLKMVVLFICCWVGADVGIKYLLCNYRTGFIVSLTYNIKEAIFGQTLNQNLFYYTRTSPNEIKQTIEDDSKELEGFFLTDIFSYILCILTVLCLVIVMLALNPILLTCCMLFFGLSYFETQIIKKKVMENAKQSRAAIVEENHSRTDEIANYREIKCLNLEDTIVKRFDRRSEKLISLITKEKVLQYANKYLGALNHDLITRFFIYITGGILVINFDFSTSSFLIFLGFYETFVQNVRKIIDSNFSFHNRKNKLTNILACLTDIDEGEKKAFSNIDGDIQVSYENVYFRYPGNQRDNWIMQGFSQELTPGVYFVSGKSGSGKSTFLKLLYKEYEAEKGRILYKGKEVTSSDLLSLDLTSSEVMSSLPADFYQLFSVAQTDSKIFNASIRENLLFANPLASENMLIKACENAMMSEYLSKFPEGLDTNIGENGSRLSGGQRERLILARLFLRESCIYILDEALSEISLTDEVAILNRLIALRRNSIFLIVSHRLLKLENAKEIKF